MTATSRAQSPQTPATPVIDYEGSPYRTAFWEGQGRKYEDAVERLALQQLLPPRGPRIAEIGAGFGRLADLYLGYEQIVLFDYSRTLLQDAVRQWGDDPRFVFVAGNLYQLPLATGSLDTLVMVRVMHHLADVPQALRQFQRVLHRHSVAVLEYANKRNLKALLRWLAGRQQWSPWALEPIEFVALNFDFHPQWMTARMGEAGLQIRRQLAVSHFRLPQLKARIDPQRLAQADRLLFGLGGRYPLSPSVFLQATAPNAAARAACTTDPADVAALFRCPNCGSEFLEMGAIKQLSCRDCGTKYRQKDGIWDFKEAVR
jgi:SAM-dependent methyltransferase/DNA-directed RNA polymerase subunit RPC12/RpoP